MSELVTEGPASAGGPASATEDRDFNRAKTMTSVGVTIAALIIAGIVATAATHDLGSRHVPGVAAGAYARPPLFGFQHWAVLFELSTMVMFGATLTVLVTNCLQQRRVTTGTVFFAAAMTLYALDPFGNWAPYAVYDPRMLHWPVSWPWASIAPNIEPVAGLFGYFGFYVGVPVLCVEIVQKWLRPRFTPESFVHRRPVVTLVIVTVVAGFVLDALIEIAIIRTGLLMYQHVVPFGSLWVGQSYQFPLLWQSLATTIPFVIVALLWWQGASGMRNAELLTMLWAPLRRMGQVGTFLLVSAAMLFGYLAFATPYIIIHKTGWATGTAQPYLFCATPVPDPHGLMKLNGQPGPYIAGFWPGPYRTEPSRDGAPPISACAPPPRS